MRHAGREASKETSPPPKHTPEIGLGSTIVPINSDWVEDNFLSDFACVDTGRGVVADLRAAQASLPKARRTRRAWTTFLLLSLFLMGGVHLIKNNR